MKKSKILIKSKFLGQWPFIVDSVEIVKDGFSIFVVSDNTKYAINGIASNSPGARSIDSIWLDDSEWPGTKVPLSDVIKFGLKI